MVSFLSLLPTLLSIVSFFLKWYGASEETIRKYEELVKSTQSDGLISVKIKNRILEYRSQIEAEEKAEANDKAK